MKKNILLITESLSNGGSEKVLSTLSNELVKYHNIYIVLSNYSNKDYIIDKKIKVYEIKELMSKNPFKRITGIRKLKKYKKNNKIDTSISFITSFNLFNVLSRVNDKVIVSTRNHLSTKKESFIARLSTKYYNKHCDLNVCPSKSVYMDQIDNFNANKNKTIVINNFININKDIKIVNKDNIIITIGRLTDHKGQIHIINAMKEVIKKVPDAKLLILGRGPLYEYFDTYIKDNNLDNNIELLGFKPNIPDYLKNSKVFVITSYYEGLSNSLLEAMSYGIPVIASDSNGGNKEVIDDKYGILIPDFYNIHDIEDNEKLLAKEIINILNNKKNYEYYSKKSLERAKDFDKNVIIKKWMDIL